MSRAIAALTVCALTGLIAGCGSSSSGPQTVEVSLTAPTDGATVTVRTIEVLGTTQPHDAVVSVLGRRVKVVDGTFRERIVLRRALTRIPIVASAAGYRNASTIVSVHFVAPPAPSSIVAAGFTNPALGGASSAAAGTPSQAQFVGGCAANGNAQKVALCGCLYRRLVAGGFFSNPAAEQALVAGWRRSLLSKGTITLPPKLRSAALTCVAQVTGKPVS